MKKSGDFDIIDCVTTQKEKNIIIKYEIEPIDFLRDDSLQCDDLYDDIVNSGKETEFNVYIEDVFPNGANPTELNDYCRFECQTIREMLGLSVDDE